MPIQSHAFAERVRSLRFDVPPNCQGQTVEAAYACDPDGMVQRIYDRSDLTTRYYVADWPQGDDIQFDPVNVEPEGIDWEPMDVPDEASETEDDGGADASNVFNIIEEEDGP